MLFPFKPNYSSPHSLYLPVPAPHDAPESFQAGQDSSTPALQGGGWDRADGEVLGAEAGISEITAAEDIVNEVSNQT